MATKILLALNILVMVAFTIANPTMLLVPEKQSLIDFGANFGLLTCTGQQWRLFSYMFLHVGILHLAVNMYALYKVGPPAEDLFGWKNYLIIYLFSGVMGSLASCLVNPMLVSSGASGAIFGVYGSLLAFMYVQRDQFPQKTLHNHALMAVCFLICNVFYGFLVPEMDSFAHYGGLLAGAFSGFLFAQLQIKEKYRIAYTMPILALLMGAMLAVTEIAFDRRGYQYYHEGVDAMKKDDFALAVDYFTLFIAMHPADADAYGNRGMAYAKMDELHRAASDFATVMALAPRSSDPYNSLAWIECGLGEYEDAIKHASRAIRINPKFSAALDTRGYAYAHLGKKAEAQADYEQAIKFAPDDPGPRYHLAKLLNQGKMVVATQVAQPTSESKNNSGNVAGSQHSPKTPWDKKDRKKRVYEPERWED